MLQNDSTGPSARAAVASSAKQSPDAGAEPSVPGIRLLSGLRITGACTLVSRVLGMFRDMATAALFGLGAGGVMDAFAVAFRIPNLFRRLFGEGALSAAFLPVFAERLERRGRLAAWELTSAVLTVLAVVLLGVLAIGEGTCWLLWRGLGTESGGLVFGLTAVMLPYLFFMCLAAQVAAVLNALGHFTMPALAPALLNVCWLVAVLFVAPWAAPDKPGQAYVLALFVLLAGLLQLAVQVPVLRSKGYRFAWNWTEAAPELKRIAAGMAPVMLGLAVMQINTLADTLIAWLLARSPGGPESFEWFGRVVAYPMQEGAAASIYFGDRVHQFPVGVFGVALGTVLYPMLARHAARGELDRLRADLNRAVRLVLVIGIPASAGLIVLAAPLAELLFRHGAFTTDDATRTARMIAGYSLGVWAYCGLQILVRAFYALGDRTTPAKVGAAVVGVNLALNFSLIWPFAETGLALSTSACAIVEVLVFLQLLGRRLGPLDRAAIGRVAARVVFASALMVLACLAVLSAGPAGPSLLDRLVRVAAPFVSGIAMYAAACWVLGIRELGEVLR